MNFTGHFVISSSVAICIPVLSRKIGIEFTGQEMDYIIPSIIFGGLFPDIDTKSVPSKLYAGFCFLSIIYFWMKDSIIYSLIPIIPFMAAKISKHRGWTHSWLLITILFISGSTSYLFGLTYPGLSIISFSIGISIHNLADKRWPTRRKNWI